MIPKLRSPNAHYYSNGDGILRDFIKLTWVLVWKVIATKARPVIRPRRKRTWKEPEDKDG